jgi:hypothetical protein
MVATKIMFEHLEGSLFDWQLGDLMPSCTACNVRVSSYAVQDPAVVSVVAALAAVPSDAAGSAAAKLSDAVQLVPYRAASAAAVTHVRL